MRILRARFAVPLLLAILLPAITHGQQSPPPRTPKPLLMPEANPMPDANDVMTMNEKNMKKKNFDAANAQRKRQIDDESAKLLILARDLNSKMENAGRGPLPPTLIREAQVIEILANDVKEKMKLTVGGN
jgi:hypothetical protein